MSYNFTKLYLYHHKLVYIQIHIYVYMKLSSKEEFHLFNKKDGISFEGVNT